jgi:hypothetical protein
MKLSKKGVESFPFFLFLTLLVAAFVITVGFYQVRTFSEFSSKKELTDSYNDMINSMENLRATADQGSFTRVRLTIPKDYNLTISADEDTITILGPNLDLNNTPGFNILNTTNKYSFIENILTLKKGEYDIVIYYGAQSNETEPFEIFFI